MNDENDKTEKPPVEDWAMSEPDVQPEQSAGTDNFDITMVNSGVSPTPAITENWAMSEPDIQPEQLVGADNFDITMVGANAPSTAAITEDWAMNVPNTNPSAEKESDTWEMPPQVFRISSGRKLDKDNRKTPPMPPSSDSPLVETQTSEIIEPVAPPNLDIQPQPYISEEFSTNQVAAKTYVKPKSSNSKLILLIVGLVAMAVLAAALAVGVYYWFFYMPE